jgi:hypothetical protein
MFSTQILPPLRLLVPVFWGTVLVQVAAVYLLGLSVPKYVHLVPLFEGRRATGEKLREM